MTIIHAENVPHPLQFPRDDGLHLLQKNSSYYFQPFGHSMEWWYFSGRLIDQQHHRYHYYVIFYYPMKKIFWYQYIYPMVQFQLVDMSNKQVYSCDNKYILRDVYAGTNKLKLSYGNQWRIVYDSIRHRYHLQGTFIAANHIPISINLSMHSPWNPFPINKSGVIAMPSQEYTYYTFLPNLSVTGNVTIARKKIQLISGSDAWYEHQWGPFQMYSGEYSYWFGVRLSDGQYIILIDYGLNPNKYSKNMKKQQWHVVNVVTKQGKLVVYHKPFFKLTFPELTSKNYLNIKKSFNIGMVSNTKGLKAHLIINATSSLVNTVGYWEGVCGIKGSWQGSQVSGYSGINFLRIE